MDETLGLTTMAEDLFDDWRKRLRKNLVTPCPISPSIEYNGRITMTPIDPKSDARLVQSVRSGVREDFAVLVDRYYAAIQAYARGHTRDDEVAQDAAQEAFLTALQCLPQLRKPEKFGPWLFTIVRNQCNTALRERKREVALEETHEQTVEPDLESREVRAIVRREIEKLPQTARDVLTLHYLGGLELPDAARLLGISHTAARKRLQRAREALGEKLLRALSDSPADSARLDRGKRQVTAMALAAAVNWNTTTAHAAGAFALVGGVIVMKKLVAVVIIAVTAFVLFQLRDRLAPTPEPTPIETELPAIAEEPEAVEPLQQETAEDPLVAVASTVNPVSAEESATEEAIAAVPHIKGRVLDDLDYPVPNAEVHLWRWKVFVNATTRDDVERLTVETDSEGFFQFAKMDAAPRLSLSPRKDGMLRKYEEDFIAAPYDGNPVDTVLRLYPAGTIRGRVVDERGRPIPDKAVTTYALDTEILLTVSTLTDSVGHFELTGITPGEHSVAVIPEEQATRSISDAKVTVGPGEIVDGIEIVYTGDDMVFAGTVIDEGGNPIRGVFVQLIGVFGPNPADTYTDEDGSFRIVRLPEGRYSGMIMRTGYENHHLVAETGSENLEFVLRRAVLTEVAIRIIDAETREPLENVLVSIQPGRLERFETMQYGTFMGVALDDGRYDAKNLRWEDMTAIFRAEGYLFGYLYVDFLSETAREFLVEMRSSPVAQGTVVTPDGEPVPNAYILTGPYPRMVLDRYPPGSEMRQQWIASAAAGRTDADGAFTIDTLDENMEVLTAIHADRGFASIPVDFTSIDRDELRIVLSPGAVIQGTVTVGGEPAEGVNVRLFQQDVGQTRSTNFLLSTEADGSYYAEQVTPGRYRVSSRIRQEGAGIDFGAGRSMQAVVDVASDQVTVVDFPFDAAVADIVGLVTIDGQPAGQGEVNLTVNTPTGVNRYSKRLDPDGTYIIKGVPAGEARVVAKAGSERVGLYSNQGAAEPIEFSIQTGPIIELDIEVSGGRTIICNITGLYSDDNFLQFMVIDGLYEDGDQIGPFGAHVTVASVNAEVGDPVQFYGLRPGTYTVIAFAIELSPERAARSSRRQLIVFEIPDDNDPEPLQLDIAF